MQPIITGLYRVLLAHLSLIKRCIVRVHSSKSRPSGIYITSGCRHYRAGSPWSTRSDRKKKSNPAIDPRWVARSFVFVPLGMKSPRHIRHCPLGDIRRTSRPRPRMRPTLPLPFFPSHSHFRRHRPDRRSRACHCRRGLWSRTTRLG